MLDLRAERGLTYLFITHDLALAWVLADRVAVMYLGGSWRSNPRGHLEAAPPVHRLGPRSRRRTSRRRLGEHAKRTILVGETPDASAIRGAAGSERDVRWCSRNASRATADPGRRGPRGRCWLATTEAPTPWRRAKRRERRSPARSGWRRRCRRLSAGATRSHRCRLGHHGSFGCISGRFGRATPQQLTTGTCLRHLRVATHARISPAAPGPCDRAVGGAFGRQPAICTLSVQPSAKQARRQPGAGWAAGRGGGRPVRRAGRGGGRPMRRPTAARCRPSCRPRGSGDRSGRGAPRCRRSDRPWHRGRQGARSGTTAPRRQCPRPRAGSHMRRT